MWHWARAVGVSHPATPLPRSVLLSLLGGAAGLLLARWARDLVWSLRPPTFTHAGLRLNLDWRVLAYTLVVSVLTGILFGLTPALGAIRSDLASDLKERTGQPAKPGGWSPRSMLVICQVAFSLIALIGAGLFVRSIRKQLARSTRALTPLTWGSSPSTLAIRDTTKCAAASTRTACSKSPEAP